MILPAAGFPERGLEENLMGEDQTERVELKLQRSPLRNIDLDDQEATWERVRRLVGEHIAVKVAVPPELLFYSTPFLERINLEGVVELGQEAALARFLFDMHLDRPQLRRRFRVGEVIWPQEGGRGRRAAAILELTDHESASWTLEYAFFGQVEQGPGRILGTWSRLEGAGVEELPVPLREWLDFGKLKESRIADETLTPPDLSGVDLRMVVLDENLPAKWPDDNEELVTALARGLEREILTQGLDAAVILVGRSSPQRLERWELRGDPGPTLEDLICSIAQLGGPGDFVSITHGGVLKLDDTSIPALFTVMERDGIITRRGLGFRVHEGELQTRTPFIETGEPSASQWLTRKPPEHLDIFMLGIAGGPPSADA